MTPSTKLIVTEQHDDLVDEFTDMFAELESMDSFDLKKDEVAANLAALLALTGTTRSELAEKQCWKKSRVTSILSGNANPTLRTIWEFCSNLGYDFDIVFRLFDEKRPSQPWQKVFQQYATMVDGPLNAKNILLILHVQTPQEVARDIVSGNQKSRYFSVENTSEYSSASSNTISLQSQLSAPQPSLNVPIKLGSLAYAK